MMILVLCALTGRWESTRYEGSPAQRAAASMAGFSSGHWLRVYGRNFGQPPVEISEPIKIAGLVRFLAEPSEEWHRGETGGYLKIGEIVFVEPDSRETRFVITSCPVSCTRPGSVTTVRSFSRKQLIQLSGFFEVPKCPGGQRLMWPI